MLTALCIAAIVVSVTEAQIGPPTIDELDVGAYLGRWYQMYASPIVYQTFEKDGFCHTADYGVFNETVLTVFNAQRLFAPDGEEDIIDGYAFTTEDPGKLFVSLDGAPSRNDTDNDFLGAPYWIMQLGEFNEYNGVEQYAYSLVSDPTRLYLFVLARDVQEFRDQYEADVLEWLDSNGFDNARNRPVKSYHEDDCIYYEL